MSAIVIFAVDLNVIGIVVTGIAALAAVLTLLYKYIENKPNVRVDLSGGVFSPNDYPTPFKPKGTLLVMQASNRGNKSVTLSSPCIELPDKNKVLCPTALSDHSLPCLLSPETSCTAWVAGKDVALLLAEQGYEGKVKIRCLWKSEVGRTYKSKKRTLNIDEYIVKSKSNAS